MRPNVRAPHRWQVWRLPPLLLCAVLLVDAAAATLLIGGLLSRPFPGASELWPAVALCVLGVVYTEVAAGVERERRRLGDASHVDLSSVWTFAAALLVPGALAAVVAAVIMVHLWARACARGCRCTASCSASRPWCSPAWPSGCSSTA
ncbi:hypothetical protein BJF90_11615 [Pseudonocardia sp. CNS-004]|nr:hypothetical protein BJF90_11615 [Pseudonocardia sp. CNS-004]